MVIKIKLLVICLALFLLSACQSKTAKILISGLGTTGQSALSALLDFKVDRINVDYIADCKARIRTPEKAYSGSCSIILTHRLELLMSVLHPLGGLMMEIYVDKDVIQIKDYGAQRFESLVNSDKLKSDLPIFRDISLLELQAVLWGRVIKPVEESFKIKYKDKKPYQFHKQNPLNEIVVSYKRWLTYESLDFPKILEIKNRTKGTSLKLAITEFKPGYARNLKIVDSFSGKGLVKAKKINP